MSRVIATNEIKEEFDGVLETPLATFPFDFDVSNESVHELQAAEVSCPTSTAISSSSSSSQLPGENDDQNCAAKSNTAKDDSMTEDEEDIATEKDDERIKVRYLNCTQPDCADKLDTLDQFYGHLRNKHGLAPFQCFCGCKSRFNFSRQISLHLQDHPTSKFACSVCAKVFKTQHKTNQHWFCNHLTGQFQCNIDNCSKVVNAQDRLRSHQQYKHCPESKRLKCAHDGCHSSFARNRDLKIHQIVHLNTKPFHCGWPECVHRTNDRRNLISHIRSKHFKKQQENGNFGERDPNKYVRVANK